MLTIFLQRKSSSIPTKEACPPVIIAASPVTSDPNVHSSKLRRRKLRGSCLLRQHQVLYLRRDIRFYGISGNNSSLFRRTHQGTTRKSRKSHAHERLQSLLQGMLRRMDSMSNTQSHLPRVHQGWVRKDETIHPLRGSGLT
jgi:hypothetical protein